MHPPHEQLLAFHRGSLEGHEAEAIADHIAECVPCLDKVEGFPPSSLERGFNGRGRVPYKTAVDELRESLIADVVRSVSMLADRYESVEWRRYGAMGILLRARLAGSDRCVALKVFDERYLSFAQNSASHLVTCRRRFRREFDVGRGLRHEHIVAINEFIPIDGRDIIEMDWVDGPSLREFVEHGGHVDEEMALHWLTALGEAMAYYGGQGVVHRDIKPENCLVDRRRPSTAIWLLDFGLAKSRCDGFDITQLTVDGGFLGTFRFAPPEQRSNPASVDIRADLYALGKTIAWVFAASDARADAEIPTRRASGVATPGMQRLLSKMTAPRPDDRFQTPEEMLDAVRAVRRKLASPAKHRWSGSSFQTLAVGGTLALIGTSSFLFGTAALRDRPPVTPLPRPPTADPPQEPPVVLAAASLDARNTPVGTEFGGEPWHDFTLVIEFASQTPTGVVEVGVTDDRGDGLSLRVESSRQAWNELNVLRGGRVDETLVKRRSLGLGTGWHTLKAVAAGAQFDTFFDGQRLIVSDTLSTARCRVLVTFSGGEFLLRRTHIQTPDGRDQNWLGPGH